jgi:hypothetical protein
MYTRIREAIVTAIALIMFVVIGARVVNSFVTWECTCSHIECEECVDDWAGYHAEAMAEYADEFTALFNSYETKRAKNGAMMIRVGDSGSFKFAKKG